MIEWLRSGSLRLRVAQLRHEYGISISGGASKEDDPREALRIDASARIRRAFQAVTGVPIESFPQDSEFGEVLKAERDELNEHRAFMSEIAADDPDWPPTIPEAVQVSGLELEGRLAPDADGKIRVAGVPFANLADAREYLRDLIDEERREYEMQRSSWERLFTGGRSPRSVISR